MSERKYTDFFEKRGDTSHQFIALLKNGEFVQDRRRLYKERKYKLFSPLREAGLSMEYGTIPYTSSKDIERIVNGNVIPTEECVEIISKEAGNSDLSERIRKLGSEYIQHCQHMPAPAEPKPLLKKEIKSKKTMTGKSPFEIYMQSLLQGYKLARDTSVIALAYKVTPKVDEDDISVITKNDLKNKLDVPESAINTVLSSKKRAITKPDTVMAHLESILDIFPLSQEEKQRARNLYKEELRQKTENIQR